YLPSAPFYKPPKPAIGQISLCHPWNVGDNYRLSTDTKPLSFHRRSADPTVHIPAMEDEEENLQGGVRGNRGENGGCRVGGKTCF
ncbi:hypothetical protein XENOCAPTIV_002571, partial [Xenoophorus captivus]